MKKYLYILAIIILPCVLSFVLSLSERTVYNHLAYEPVTTAYLMLFGRGVFVGICFIVVLVLSKRVIDLFQKGFYINMICLLVYPIICLMLSIFMMNFGPMKPIGYFLNMTFVLGWQYSLPHIVLLIMLYLFLNLKKIPISSTFNGKGEV